MALADVSMPARRLEEHHAYLQPLMEPPPAAGRTSTWCTTTACTTCPSHGAPGARPDDLHVAHAADPVAGVGCAGGPMPGDLHRGHRSPRLAARDLAIRVIRNGVDSGSGDQAGRRPPLWSGRSGQRRALTWRSSCAPGWQPLTLSVPSLIHATLPLRVEPCSAAAAPPRHLTHDGLAVLLGRASACPVTPADEPYGPSRRRHWLWTPVCGFAWGALPELLDEQCAVLSSLTMSRRLPRVAAAARACREPPPAHASRAARRTG